MLLKMIRGIFHILECVKFQHVKEYFRVNQTTRNADDVVWKYFGVIKKWKRKHYGTKIIWEGQSKQNYGGNIMEFTWPEIGWHHYTIAFSFSNYRISLWWNYAIVINNRIKWHHQNNKLVNNPFKTIHFHWSCVYSIIYIFLHS